MSEESKTHDETEKRPKHASPKAGWRAVRDSFGFWFGIISFAVSTALGFYWYYASDKAPRLVYAVSAAKAELKRPDFDNKLQIEYGGVEVDSDVTIVQVAIWNAGSRSIRNDDILSALTLQMAGNAPILSARIKQTTREVCKFTFDNGNLAVSQSPRNRIDTPLTWTHEQALHTDPQLSKGVCSFKFRILEPEDGALVQIIYEGDASKDPQISGIFEGQREVDPIRSQDVSVPTDKLIRGLRFIVAGEVAALTILSSLLFFRLRKRDKTPQRRYFKLFFISTLLSLFLMALVWAGTFWLQAPRTPFSF
jgi:hypothetical protein